MASNPYHGLAKLGRVQLPSGNTYALIDYNGRELIAPMFSASGEYVVGDYVVYDDDLWRCSAAHSGAAWNADHFEQVTVGSELRRIESAISGGIHYRGHTTSSLYDGSTTNPIIINGSPWHAIAGDMVIEEPPEYSTGRAYASGEYCTNDGIIYQVTEAISASDNTQFSDLKTKIATNNPEFIFDGTLWDELGSINPLGLGELAYKDSASGTYVKPTGSGSVTVKEYSTDGGKLVTTSITGVGGTESVSKMTAGTAVEVAKIGTAVRYGTANVGSAVTYGTANKASTATTVGNANVGAAVTYGNANVAGTQTTVGNADVGEAVSVATAGTQVVYGTADVGAAVTYGTANPGTAITGVAKVGGSKTFAASGVVTSVSDDCLVFETASTDTVIGIADATGISITPAVASNTTLTPAIAADTTRKLTPVGGTTDITPAVTSTTKIFGAVASSTTLTPAVASSTTIYGAVDSTLTLTPAVAAPNDQTLTPAVANGTITPWTEASKTVATSAASAITVATGTVSSEGTGSAVVTGVTGTDTSKTVTVGTASDTVTVR